jgi:chemotaxis protein MotB
MVFALMLLVAVYHYTEQLNGRIRVIEGAMTSMEAREQVIDSVQAYLRRNPSANIEIDTVTAMIRLNDQILFEEASFELLPAGLRTLDGFMEGILPIILAQDSFVAHLDEIIVEGHTNDNGPFAYNLYLSQQRAFTVMQHLLNRAPDEYRGVLEEHMTANGRSYSWPVCSDGEVKFYRSCGTVDKELSRRIELRFRLDDDEVLRQVDSLLQVRVE